MITYRQATEQLSNFQRDANARYIVSYEDFIKKIYSCMEKVVIPYLTSQKQDFCDQSEDQLSTAIVGIFRGAGFLAQRESSYGGHVDISIIWPGKSYTWLAEAKIDHNHKHIYEGYLQLTTRYATGIRDQDQGAIISYIKKKSATRIFQNYFRNIKSKDQSLKNAPTEILSGELSFKATTTLESSGLDYHITHFGIPLYFNPQDKSGRTSHPATQTFSKIPYFTEKIAAGFPTATSGDLADDGINLHEKFVTNPEKSYVLQVSGLSMIGAGIPEGAYILVERIPHKHGDIVVALINGESTLKRFIKTSTSLELHPENPEYPIIKFTEADEVSIQGVVTCVMFRP